MVLIIRNNSRIDNYKTKFIDKIQLAGQRYLVKSNIIKGM